MSANGLVRFRWLRKCGRGVLAMCIAEDSLVTTGQSPLPALQTRGAILFSLRWTCVPNWLG